MTSEQKELILFWIEEIEEQMNSEDYQRDFFESLAEYFRKHERFSEKQMECLKKIYERVTG